MSSLTTNYHFIKPEGTDKVAVETINSNIDMVDSALKSVENNTPAISISTALSSGVLIGTINLNGVNYQLFAPQGGGGSGSYSTDERVVGTWINGKPIYEQILHIDNEWDSNMHIPVANLEYLLSSWGFGIDYYTGTSMPISMYFVSNRNMFTIGGDYDTGVTILVGEEFYEHYTDVYLVIRYTKTTD